MTQTELIAALQVSFPDIPLCRDHTKENPKTPYMVIRASELYSFAADNIVYAEKDTISLFVYTQKIDTVLESRIKTFLEANEIGWTRSETFDTDEKVWEVEFGFEIM